jgi:HEAT repeat protein
VNFWKITVEDMDLSLEDNNDEWYNSLPHKGAVYDLVSAAMSGGDVAGRLRAVTALGKCDDPRAVRPLMDLLSDRDPEIRMSATTALGHLKSGRPVNELINRMRDPSERTVTREQAIVALTSIRSTGALRGLKEFVADNDEDPGLRSYADTLMGNIGLW